MGNDKTTEGQVAASKDAHERDWFLQQLVSLANAGTGVSVTLIVGGSMVCGTLLSGKQYFEEFGKLLASATVESAKFPSDLQKQIESTYAGLGVNAYADERPSLSLAFIHLKAASIWHGEFHSPQSLWRVRLSEVGGFALGAMVKKD